MIDNIHIEYLIDKVVRQPLDVFDLDYSKDQILSDCIELGAYILDHEKADLEAQAVFLLLLSRLTQHDYSLSLLDMASTILVGGRTSKINLSSSDVDDFDAAKANAIAYRIVNNKEKQDLSYNESWYNGQGTLKRKNNEISLYPCPKNKISEGKFSASIKALKGKISVMQVKADRLRQSEVGDLKKIMAFTDAYVKEIRSNTTVKLPRYSVGDTMKVRIIGKSAGSFTVQTTNPKFERITGTYHPINTYYFFPNEFYDNFEIGDVIECELEDDANKTFSILNPFVNFVVNEYSNITSGYITIGKVILVGKKNLTLLTREGAIVQSLLDDYTVGNYVELRIDSIKERGWVNAEILGRSDEEFDAQEVKKDVILNYIYVDDEEPVIESLPDRFVKELNLICFAYQQAINDQVEKVQTLCVSNILSSILSDEVSASYVHFSLEYFAAVSAFARGEIDSIARIIPDSSIAARKGVAERVKLVDVLKSYDTGDDSFLNDYIAEGYSPTITDIAKLIQSNNRISDLVPVSVKNSIRRKILDLLAVNISDNQDVENIGGEFIGEEGDTMEFKTSFVFPPDNNMQPDLSKQERNIFKGICAFLNSDFGGTLYLGVNDAGMVVGIDNDLKYLNNSLDGYKRLIQDEARKFFSLDVLQNVSIKSSHDGKVVSIHITPCQDKVVELENVAYRRYNGTSIKMTDTIRHKLEGRRKVRKNMDKEAKIGGLNDAMQKKKMVILHGYTSPSSGAVTNRKVEPFDFDDTTNYVWCYELASHKVKQFKIARIGNVEILDEDWRFEKLHHSQPTDFFHMSGEEPMHMVLRLDIRTYSLLKEEYPGCEKYLTQESDSSWILDADFRSIEGIGRFYLGLANHIDIIDAPDLVAYKKEMKEML